ncbi:hypothetical protein PsYK624_065420 [Phanerochaete sordida]|uniref:Uncharacterized protein n=1 Tax=Phanerochaete sordida TaxID=48140 RepID=A0A9P3G9H7_9APHY|nr:hypothetical protein PsYK624_065420 [Phanerochaete sordida]
MRYLLRLRLPLPSMASPPLPLAFPRRPVHRRLHSQPASARPKLTASNRSRLTGCAARNTRKRHDAVPLRSSREGQPRDVRCGQTNKEAGRGNRAPAASSDPR